LFTFSSLLENTGFHDEAQLSLAEAEEALRAI